MRILTRYILREVTAHALIGAAHLHLCPVHSRSRTHSRTGRPRQRSAAQRRRNFLLHRPARAHLHAAHERAARNSDRSQPSRRRQRNHRHARQRHGRVDLPSRPFASLLSPPGSGPLQRPLHCARAPRPRSAIWKTALKARRFPSRSSRAFSTRDSPRSSSTSRT